MDAKSLLGSDRTRIKHLAVNFRTSRVYNAGLIVSVENDKRKAEHKPSIIEMTDCAVELVVNSIGKDFIKPSVKIIKIDLCNNNCKTQFKLNGGG